jgi:phosphatidate cytidylyltransferase
VSAGIPGIESGTVGLEDVVAASGDDSVAIQAPKSSDLPLRVLTAVGLIVIFLGSLYQPYLIGALILIVLGLAAGEIYTVLIRAGHHPLAIFGFVGVAGAMIGTWIWEPVAIPMAILLTLVATLLFYGVVPDRSRPLHNTSLTMLGVLWIGGLGGFAFDIIKAEDYAWLVAALVVTVALMDIGQYFVGRRIGKRALAPVVSPKKTVEGLVAGVLVALLVGVGFSYFGPFDLGSGLLIGAVVALVAPIGDLAVSVIKRAIGVKDMSSILPGHGGILDRIDAMIFTIPAMWIAYSWLGLLA